MNTTYTFFVKSQHLQKFMRLLSLDFRPFNWKVLVKIFDLKGLKSIDKGHTNFYECCDLTEKVYLIYLHIQNICKCMEELPMYLVLVQTCICNFDIKESSVTKLS